MVLGASALLAACGQSSPGEAIHLGSILSVSGNKAQPGQGELLSVKLAVDEINAGGGVNGLSMVLDNRDDHSGSEGARSAAVDIISHVHAPAIVGTTAPETTLAAAEMTIPANVVLISDIASGPQLNHLADKDSVFSTAPDRSVQGQILGQRARARGFTKAAVLFVDLPLHTETASGFVDTFTRMGGTVTVNMKIPDAQKSYTDVLARVYAAGNPDCILINAEAPDGVQFMKDYLTGYSGKPTFFFFNPAMANADFFEGVGYQNFTFRHEGIDVADGPGIDAYAAAHEAKWGPKEVLEPGIYDDVYLIALAMQAGGGTDAETIKANIRAINDPTGVKVGPGEFAKAVSILKMGGKINYEGASGSCDFDQDGAAKAANLIWEVQGTERATTVEQIDL
jgi:ABC-type branched-subunit amino acid transport system substrate-binding protein